MKKFIIFLLELSIALTGRAIGNDGENTLPAFAQRHHFSVGPQIGTSFSMPTFAKKNSKLGFNTGVRFEGAANLFHGVLFAVEFRWVSRPYSTKTLRGEYVEGAHLFSFEACPKYIDLPLLMGYRWTWAALKSSLHLMSGPIFGIGVSGKQTSIFTDDDGMSRIVKSDCFNNAYNRVYAGWKVELGFRVNNGHGFALGYERQLNHGGKVDGHHFRNQQVTLSWISFLNI